MRWKIQQREKGRETKPITSERANGESKTIKREKIKTNVRDSREECKSETENAASERKIKAHK